MAGGSPATSAALHHRHDPRPPHLIPPAPQTVAGALGSFFFRDGDDIGRATAVVTAFVASLQRLRDVLAAETGLRFYSSSLLFMYDGDPDAVQPSIGQILRHALGPPPSSDGTGRPAND